MLIVNCDFDELGSYCFAGYNCTVPWLHLMIKPHRLILLMVVNCNIHNSSCLCSLSPRLVNHMDFSACIDIMFLCYMCCQSTSNVSSLPTQSDDFTNLMFFSVCTLLYNTLLYKSSTKCFKQMFHHYYIYYI